MASNDLKTCIYIDIPLCLYMYISTIVAIYWKGNHKYIQYVWCNIFAESLSAIML